MSALVMLWLSRLRLRYCLHLKYGLNFNLFHLPYWRLLAECFSSVRGSIQAII